MSYFLEDCLTNLINSFITYPDMEGIKIGFIDTACNAGVGLVLGIDTRQSDIIMYYLEKCGDRLCDKSVLETIRKDNITSISRISDLIMGESTVEGMFHKFDL